jgi:F-type H+-transporting ATPase subunit a
MAMPAYSSGGEEGNVGETLMHHVVDQNAWQPLPFLKPIQLHDIKIGSFTIPVTKFVVMLLINALLLIGIFVGAFRKSTIVPSKGASFLEPVVYFVRDSIVYPAMGEEMGKKWLPYFYTLFFFILGANVLGIIPIFSTATGCLSVTAALAIISLILVLFMGIKKHGFLGYFANMIPKGLPLPIALFVFCIEVPVLFIRNAVLAIRLFANMIAGHLIISSLLLLIFLIHPLASVVSVPIALGIDLLEVLIAGIQAMVFTMLTAIFIYLAVEHE